MSKTFPTRRLATFALCALGLLGSLIPRFADACSALLYPTPKGGDVIVGRNFDWEMNHGFITINKRHVEKSGVPNPGNTRATWVSKYGSITFTQISRDLPQGGVNEAGLLVESLELGASVYPQSDARTVVSELEWVQYQLDRYATVSEVLAHVNDIRIRKLVIGVHYFVCDRTGACATVEALAGQMVVHRLSDLPVLTNDSYGGSRAYAETYLERNRCASVPAGVGSLDRFARAACAVDRLQKQPSAHLPVTGAYGVLDLVRDPDDTRWSFVYNLTRGEVYIRTKAAPRLKSVRLNAFNYSCRTPALRMDINNPATGDVSAMIDGDGFYEDPTTGEWNPFVGLEHILDTGMESFIGMTKTARCTE